MGPGPPKPLRPWRGVPLVAHAAGAIAAAGLPGLVVVRAGPDGLEVARAACPLRRVLSPLADEGLSRSLAAGLAAAPPEWQGALVVLADMPAVAPATLAALAARLGRAPAPLAVVPVHAGARGNPVGLARGLWPRAAALVGDRGARALLPSLGGRLVEVPVGDGGVLMDFDDPAALAAAEQA